MNHLSTARTLGVHSWPSFTGFVFDEKAWLRNDCPATRALTERILGSHGMVNEGCGGNGSVGGIYWGEDHPIGRSMSSAAIVTIRKNSYQYLLTWELGTYGV